MPIGYPNPCPDPGLVIGSIRNGPAFPPLLSPVAGSCLHHNSSSDPGAGIRSAICIGLVCCFYQFRDYGTRRVVLQPDDHHGCCHGFPTNRIGCRVPAEKTWFTRDRSVDFCPSPAGHSRLPDRNRDDYLLECFNSPSSRIRGFFCQLWSALPGLLR